ncbi:dual specificity protein phosphatase family protein [Marinomonas pontica]|uniref:dual specificity protein phosphatase family protein n=1 Tax=Marinomonas pontica TaxID=264739 RepID=UPI0022446D52|nr:dual specificity protein phosphatase [Marinomonas pontica]MCW8354750.1 dual specificity protein phosphatase family protein [Marinomonas pontica]
MTSEKIKKRYPRPPISLIESNIPGWEVDIYIGGSKGVADAELLEKHNIKVVLNCAINLDIDLVHFEEANTPEHLLRHGSGRVRYFKIGLIDGAGNPEAMILAGYHLMRSALDQELPEKASYKVREKGNILVNCRGGRSRSVTIVALFLHLEYPDRYPTLETAIAHIREKRELHPDEWFETPKPALIQLAERAAEMEKTLRQAGFGRTP